MRKPNKSLGHSYMEAKQIVLQAGYAAEIDWQETVSFSDLTESKFLREFAWVVLSSGFRESVLRVKFPEIQVAFCNFLNASRIVNNKRLCYRNALASFRHPGKISSILKVSEIINKRGFEAFRENLSTDPINFLSTLPYIGPATSYHLAKNIGFDVVKPDRHLVRIADSAGFSSPQQLCESIKNTVGDSLAVIDVVIWRYATLRPLADLPKANESCLVG